MSRFSNLEFDSEGEGRFEQPKTFVKDEAYYMAQAKEVFENGDFQLALRLYSKVLEFNPLNAGAWTSQVRMLIELDELAEACLWADKALERFPNEPELLAAKAVALGRKGDLDGALAFSDSAIEERGDTSYVWLARGDVMLARDEKRADYCFEKAVLLAPGDWVTAWLAGRVRYYYHQFALALKLLQQALELNSAHFLLWLELGRCQQTLGLIGPARLSFTQARQLNPQCSEAAKGLSRVSQAGFLSRILGLWRRLF